MSFMPSMEEQKAPTVYSQVNMNRVVPGTRIALVFDHPTMEDITKGQPLQGSYGSVTEQCLSIARLTKSEVSVLYVFPDRTSLVGVWTERTGFTVTGGEYLERLKTALEKLGPNLVMPCGEVPLQALTQRKGILKWRGSILSSTLVQVRTLPQSSETSGLLQVCGLTSGMKVVPTVCPKVTVRAYLQRYYLIHDLKKAIKESYKPELDLPQRTLVVQPSFTQAVAFLEKICAEKPKVAFDIECHKNEVSCISFATSPYFSMSIPFNNDWSEDEEIKLWLLVARVLQDELIEKELQNAMFDRSFLMFRNRIITRGYVHDTMIKHNINYPDFPKGLGFICSIYTREPYYKDDGKTWFEDLRAGKGDIRQFYEYNAKDSAVLLEADPELTEELKKYGNDATYEFNRRLMEPLLYMMQRGIRVNKEKLAQHRTDAAAQRDAAQAQLDALTCAQAGWKKPLNVKSPKQCVDYFYNVLGYPPLSQRKKVNGEHKTSISAGNKQLKKLATKGCVEARLAQTVRAYHKLIGTYLDIKFDSDDRLRCSFNIAGTNTGRLSSSSTIFGTGTNMQNLPKVFKEFLEADPGMIMCEMDKAQAEWVVVAYLCGDANMISTIENREDAHINTAHLMFGAPKELLKLEDDLLGSLSDEDQIRKIREEKIPEILAYRPLANMSCRQGGKKSNHGLNYDLGVNGFAQTYGMTIEDAKRCYNLYHRAYPAIKIWHAHVRSQLTNDRTLTNLFGRKRRFLDRWGDDLFKAAYAYVPQSTVAQLLNYGLIMAYEVQHDKDKEFLRYWDLLLQVHDSELFQFPVNRPESLAATILYCKKVLEIPLVANGRTFVIRTDAKLGYDAKNLEKLDIETHERDLASRIVKLIEKLDAKRAEKLATKTPVTINPDDEEFADDEEIES